MDADPLWTLRAYLVTCLIADGIDPWLAAEAVATIALDRPGWDLDEQRTWQQWEDALTARGGHPWPDPPPPG